MRILPGYELRGVSGALRSESGSAKLYLFVSVLLATVLVAVVAGLWLRGGFGQSAGTTGVDGRDNFGRTANFQKKELERQKTYSGYVALFEQLLSDYKVSPSDKAKTFLEEIAGSAKKDFPGEYKKSDFIVPCLSEGCISGAEDEKVLELIAAIKTSSADERLKELVVSDLIGLGSYEFVEEAKAIGYYNQAFVAAVSVLDMDKSNSRLAESIVDFEELIAQKFPTKYKYYKNLEVYRLTNENAQSQ